MRFSKWKVLNLGDAITLQRGFDLPSAKRVSGMYPIISSSGFTDYHNEPRVCGPGVVTGRYGTIGEVFFSKGDFWPLNTTLYIKEFNGNDEKFIYYLLKTIDFKRFSDKSAVPGINRNHVHTIEIKLPGVDEQRAIAHILTILDEKIEVNNQINKILESMAQALFKQWFIDFEFPNEYGDPYKSSGGEMVESELGLIPKGWKVQSLDAIAVFLNGLAMQKYPVIGKGTLSVLKIKELRQGYIDSNSDSCTSKLDERFIVEDGDVIFSWSGSLLVDVWTGGRVGLNQHLFKVTSDDYSKWFYYYWTKKYLERFAVIAASKATTMGHIKRKDLKDAKVIVPTVDILQIGDDDIGKVLDMQIERRIENRALISLRNALISKLMSGEIRVHIEEN